jgi:2-keto-4-pentenoate hydratase/2-oxohepta-3-ene-1,7-dioic acid hydratase in catechol pathway
VTARDLQIEDGQWTRSKSFDTFAPLGPFIATELDPRNACIVTRVNGRQRQSSNTRELIFDVDYLVRFISRIMTLEVGDVITTGTPAGVGQLRAGDSVDVDITGIGTLSNNVISEQDEKLSATNCLKPHV